MKKVFMLFVMMIGLAGTVSAQTKMLKPTLQTPKSVPSTITLVYPNGGEAIVQGSRQTIQWKVAGTAPALRIELLRNGGTVQTLAKNISAAKGKFVWNVGRAQPGVGYAIRMIATATGVTTASKRPFSIVVATARAPVATQPENLKPAPYASGIPETSVAKYPPVHTGALSPAKEEQTPATGLLGPEQKIAKPWFKEDQGVEGASPSLVPSTGTRPFFEPEDSPPETKAPVVTYGGGQDSPYQGRLEQDRPETKLPEQSGAWFKEFVETPARQETLPTTSMETELATFPDFEVGVMTFDPETRHLDIHITNRGNKDHPNGPLELRWQLDDLGPQVMRKDHLTLSKGEEKTWGITLDRSWNWPMDKGRLRCDVTVDPNNAILESDEDNNRHALWFYKTSGPDVNLAADHLLVGLREKTFNSTQVLELEPQDVHELQDQEHAFEVNVKIPLVNYGDQAASGGLFIFAPEYYSGATVSRKSVSLQKGEMRWIVVRRLMGTPSPGYKIPFKVTWEDDDHVLFEGDLQASPALFEQLGSLPDLHPSSFGLQATNPVGSPHRIHQPCSFLVGVRNIGGPTDETFRLLVEVTGPGGNVVYTVKDVIQGLDHLGIRDNLRHEFIPEESGYYTIRLKADSDRDVLEYDEDNNEFSSGFRIHGESTDSDDRVP